MTEPPAGPSINELQQLSLRLQDAFETFELLDSTGHVPASPQFAKLMRHVTDTQELSVTTAQLAASFSADRDRPSNLLARVHGHLASAVVHSCSAAHLFARTAQTSAPPAPAHGAADEERREWRMVFAHSEARAELRLASEDITAAVQRLQDHDALERFLKAARRPPAPAAGAPPTRRAR